MVVLFKISVIIMKSTDKSGPRIEPCGTPDLTGNVEDVPPPHQLVTFFPQETINLIAILQFIKDYVV